MPVRIRVTLLFILFAFILLGIVCSSIYYFSSLARVNTIKKRLTNRAITTARLLTRGQSFDQRLIRQFDSLTAVSLKEKLVQVYDHENRLIYQYSDIPNDNFTVDEQVLKDASAKQSLFFRRGNREAVVYHYFDQRHGIVIVSAADDEDGKANLIRLRYILITSFILGIITSFIVGYFFSKRLLAPIKKISKEVSEISVQNLARRVSAGPVHDEWYSLVTIFNELLDKLQEGFETQRRFISNASHELSTPLTSISSQLAVVLEAARTSTEYEKVIQSVYHDVRHISKLTQTLLEFAGASGSKGGLEITVLRIDEIVLNLPSEINKLNSNYSVGVDFEQVPDDEKKLLVFGNEALLTAALKNIVSNACKYSPDHLANVTLKTGERNIIIEISDKGIGIAEDELDHIFEPFYRVQESKSVGAGFGLGLSIAYRVIKLHRGSISVRSRKGVGTNFIVALPCASHLEAT